MKIYMAPMEGLTGYIYRKAHNACFNNIDKYFSPFISTNQSSKLKTRELNDILPENNEGLYLIPQLLSNNSKDFISMANKINQFGYEEINLNLGCPFGTVVSKNKGSGFLAKTQELDVFLDEVFSQCKAKISVKTRLGKDAPEEFYTLIDIFNKYPIYELTIHPRIQKDFYKNKPNLRIFKEALKLSKNPICYNGDIFTLKDYNTFKENFPDINSVMLGRGVLSNPCLTREINQNIKIQKQKLKEFHDKLYDDYKSILSGDINVLFKMKGLWFYMICLFSNNEKYAKRIKKSVKLRDYEEAVSILFNEQDILEDYQDNLVYKEI
ncbi:putative tRNA-dihydrouridine synthase [Oxobacter pfennigii]|uniref:tRNA-dihydrouridine synthase n=1 Tax=Oxobacter pfennigii TaxID=36849 RepID=A0A0P8WAC0_9CLOT|nr:tRNA-dihydrouridine synthase family protein [Oxobacter pfennigii]KPU45570.1 putative tRNA-dihydrouridine synthase [Oxobacter pfennigii]